MEIERKFVLGDVPDLGGSESVSIEQGYLALAVDGGAEVRLRRQDGERLLTVKGGTGKVRAEEEIELDAERFDSLWPLTDGRRLAKTRYLIPLGEHTVELDVYEGKLEGLVTAEVEFGSEAEADAFRPPEWLGREVTGDQRYLNESLASVGQPRVSLDRKGNRFGVSVIDRAPDEAKIAAATSGGPSRKFRLRRTEPLPYGVRRVARGRLDSAVERLRDPDADEVEAIHEARKDLKKLRSTLRLVRPVVGEEVYQRENERYRDASRRLSETRDAQVLAETIDSLEHGFADQPPPGGWGEIRDSLAPREADDGAEIDRLRGRAAAEIEAGRGEVESLPLPGHGFDVVGPGLRRAYSRGRKRLAEAASEPSDERLHEWRKRSKDLWYHLRLLRPAWRPVLEPLADQARELSDLLGDDHDLVVLESRIAETDIPLSDDQRRDLGELIARRRAELQAQAFALGERLYAEKPKAFARRIGAYWEAARA